MAFPMAGARIGRKHGHRGWRTGKRWAALCIALSLSVVLPLTGCVPREEQMFEEVASGKYPYLMVYQEEDSSDTEQKIGFHLTISELEDRLMRVGYPVSLVSTCDYWPDVKELYFEPDPIKVRTLDILTAPVCLQAEMYHSSEERKDGSKPPKEYISKLFICYNIPPFVDAPSADEVQTFLRAVALCVNPSFSDEGLQAISESFQEFAEAKPEASWENDEFSVGEFIFRSKTKKYRYEEYLCPKVCLDYCEFTGVKSGQSYKNIMICPEGQRGLMTYPHYPVPEQEMIQKK